MDSPPLWGVKSCLVCINIHFHCLIVEMPYENRGIQSLPQSLSECLLGRRYKVVVVDTAFWIYSRFACSSHLFYDYYVVSPRVSVVSAATRLTVEAKQNSLKRQKTTERNRVYNKSRKSEIATRMKKVFTALDEFKASPPKSESDLEPVGALISEAYQVIDKAVVKGIMHRNTAARRKARLAKARQYILVEAGLYTPSQ